MARPTCKDCYWFQNAPELDECAVYWEGTDIVSADCDCCERFAIIYKEPIASENGSLHGDVWFDEGLSAVTTWLDGKRNEIE